MGLLIIFVFLLIIGIFLLRSYDWDILGIFLIMVSLLILCGSIIGIIKAEIATSELHIQYTNDKEYLDQVYTNTNITDNERVRATKIIMDDNNIIQINNYWYNNFWIGIFQPNLTDLTPFKQLVPTCNTKIEIDNK